MLAWALKRTLLSLLPVADDAAAVAADLQPCRCLAQGRRLQLPEAALLVQRPAREADERPSAQLPPRDLSPADPAGAAGVRWLLPCLGFL